MKASVIRAFGKPDVFRYEDVPTPEPQRGYVVVKVGACGLNRYDLYLRMGGIRRDIPFPHVMGADIAGTEARDFDLKAGSEAIDTGLSVPNHPADFLNRPVPSGAGTDIGAFEYSGE